MKKIVLASAAMGGAALVAFGASGTFAAFSDQTTVENSLGAGTVLLSASSPSATTADEALALPVGGEAQYAYWLQNNGDFAGNVTTRYVVTASSEDGCEGPERAAGDDCYTSDAGDLPAFTTVQGHYVEDAESAADCTIDRATDANLVSDGRNPYPPANFAASADKDYAGIQIAEGDGYCLVLDIALPDTPDASINRVQSDQMTFGVRFTLTQVTS